MAKKHRITVLFCVFLKICKIFLKRKNFFSFWIDNQKINIRKNLREQVDFESLEAETFIFFKNPAQKDDEIIKMQEK